MGSATFRFSKIRHSDGLAFQQTILAKDSPQVLHLVMRDEHTRGEIACHRQIVPEVPWCNNHRIGTEHPCVNQTTQPKNHGKHFVHLGIVFGQLVKFRR